jgi:hypothetical protein
VFGGLIRTHAADRVNPSDRADGGLAVLANLDHFGDLSEMILYFLKSCDRSFK